MPFYEVLKLLMEEPGKHHFTRKSWYGKPAYVPKFVCSVGYGPGIIKLMYSFNDGTRHTGQLWNPSAGDITAADWYELSNEELNIKGD